MKEQHTLLPNTFFIKLKQSALLFILLPFLCSCSESPQVPTTSDPNETPVSGPLASDTVWSRDNSPYIVTGDVIVPREVTLTIEPGTAVRFDGFYGIVVKGTLNAVGIPDSAILFTSHLSNSEIGSWKGIAFENIESKNILQYIKLEYADGGINCFLSSPQIMDSWIVNNKTGISLNVSPASIIHNSIQNNIIGIDIVAKAVSSASAPVNISHNIITHNENGIVVIDSFQIMKQNNIIDNFEHGVLVKGHCSITFNSQYCQDIDARGNWWGNVDTLSIANLIFDNGDFSRLHRVRYIPYATSEIRDAGVRLEVVEEIAE